MPLWSLTLERLERLKSQIAAKKLEHDELAKLSEKDLWCHDLDAFAEEWENQLRLDAEIQTSINRMGRRVSKKIGAGRGRRPKGDDDYQPDKKTARAPKVTKVETKTHQRFAEMFAAKPKAKPKTGGLGADGAADDSDDDFSLLGKPKAAAEPSNARNKRAAASKAKTYVLDDEDDDSDFDFQSLGKTEKPSEPPEVKDEPVEELEDLGEPEETPEVAEVEPLEEVEEVVPKPRKRAAASKPKAWTVDDDASDSDGDNLLGDVGAMVKGIQAPATSSKGGRLSLFAMSRPESSGNEPASTSAAVHKIRAKPSRTFDFDSHDDTNYEALAMSSPRKSTKGDDLDGFLSSDDDLPPPTKVSVVSKAASSQAAASKAKAPLSVVSAGAAVKKPRGRPAGAKAKAKPVTLSPAAKAYAKNKAKKVVDDDDDDDDMMDAPPPKPAAKPRGRPGRAAAAKAKPIVLDDDSMDVDQDDAFAMDDSD